MTQLNNELLFCIYIPGEASLVSLFLRQERPRKPELLFCHAYYSDWILDVFLLSDVAKGQ